MTGSINNPLNHVADPLVGHVTGAPRPQADMPDLKRLIEDRRKCLPDLIIVSGLNTAADAMCGVSERIKTEGGDHNADESEPDRDVIHFVEDLDNLITLARWHNPDSMVIETLLAESNEITDVYERATQARGLDHPTKHGPDAERIWSALGIMSRGVEGQQRPSGIMTARQMTDGGH